MDYILQQSTKLETLKICFIDNDEEDRKEIESALEELGNSGNWTVVDISENTIQDSINGMYDIVVSDFKMPGKDGIQVLEEIRQRNRTVILALYTAFAISKNSEEDRRCEKAVIKRFKKYDGVGCLLGTLQNQIRAIRKELSAAPTKETTKQKAFYRWWRLSPENQGNIQPEEIIKNQNLLETETELSSDSPIKISSPEAEIKDILLAMAEDLVKELETSEDKEAYIYHSTYGKITIVQLQDHVKNLTPLGIDHIKNWLMARKRIKDRNK